MIKDKSQSQSIHEGNKAFISQPIISQAMLHQLSAFKKGMGLSTKDYVIICGLAILLLVLFAAVISMKPWELFHIISNEQLQAMKQQNFQELMQESLIGTLHNNPAIEFLRNAGWKSVWFFLCFLPQIILGVLSVFFPLFSLFHAILKRDVKEMMQQWETVSKQQYPGKQSLDKIR
ncbi:hypothetical protein [Bartonella massiliensis]|uniref:hypothetical protein n=1 Tax=Bartonella massiliensis TaxID=929795 RepID=UPI0011598862|nr:hypothetical protein [Bartonella massiliensis]